MSTLITYFELLAFIASLAAWPCIRKSNYLRLFPLLLFIVVAVEVWLTFFKESFRYYNSIIYNVQVPLQHLLYLFILYKALERKLFKHIILSSIAIFVVVAPLTIYTTEANRINSLGYCTGSLFIITGILFKFYEMLQNPVEFNFLRNPFFYMLFAFLLFNVGTLPYFTMGNWLYYTLKRGDILKVLVNVMSLFNYVLYCTYTISLVWLMLKKESS